MSKNIAIVLAGGKGNRFNSNTPKQYQLLFNKPIIYYSLKTFLEHNLIDFVLPVINIDHQKMYLKILRDYNLFKHTQLMQHIIGGNERKESVYNALKLLKSLQNVDINKVIIHDSARPFVSTNLISTVLNNTDQSKGCIPILHCKDSVKTINNNYLVQDELNRDLVVRSQTPQCFPFDILFNTYTQYFDENFTDDAGIFAKSKLPICTVPGHILNQKITTKEDLDYLECMTTVKESKIGQGFDVHAFSNNKKLILGGIHIPYIKGLDGHSDADVVIHSLVDAILGALGKGDIGDYFPPTDIKWKDVNSKIFLLKAKSLLIEYNCIINNIDITILCEEPKLFQYKMSIANNIANILAIDVEKVNVKSTTTEKLGFLGRKEGIATITIVSLLLQKFNNTILEY